MKFSFFVITLPQPSYITTRNFSILGGKYVCLFYEGEHG